MRDCDVIVIGSGAGGLTAALALARAGKKVQVFEQHYLPGGWCHSFALEGYSFSPGVHYIGELGPGGGMRRIYEGLGVANDLVFLELDPEGYDRLQVGDEIFAVPKGKERWKHRLVERFPAERAGIERYLDTVERIGHQLGTQARVSGLGDALSLPWRLRTVLHQGFKRFDAFLDGFTHDPMLRAILSFQAGDYAVPPSRAPAVLQAAIQNHYLDGAWYPRGGARALPRAFIKQLRAHGGDIAVRAPVQRILLEGGQVIGVRLGDGAEVRADVVVSNADPHVTWERLVGREQAGWRMRRWLDRVRYSVSALSLFFAVDMDLRAAGLTSGNLWYSSTPDIEAAYQFAHRTSLDDLAEFPATFLTVTTLKDPGRRRDGVHTCEAFAFVSPQTFAHFQSTAHGARPEAYEALKHQLTDAFFRTLERVVPGLRERVVFHTLGTPLTNRHFVDATHGSVYGTEKTLRNIGPFGLPVKTHIPGLYQCGQSTTSHGVAGVTQSGLLAAQAILGARRRDLLSATGQSLRTWSAEAPETWPV